MRRQLALLVLLAGAIPSSQVAAIEAVKNEKAFLKACERQLCRAAIKKDRKGRPIACRLNKTWGKAKISKGASQKAIRWNFGDAQCAVKLKIPRHLIVDALTTKKYSVFVPRHTVNCRVETGKGIKPVKIELEPKIKFKKGRAYKAWLKVKNVEGPGLIKGLIVTTAKLQDSIGIFHGELIREVNEFLHEKCPEKYSKKK